MSSLLSRFVDVVARSRVYVAGMECTGSTFVYQIAVGLGVAPRKVHHYVNRRGPKLVTYRDPRDVICSYARRQFQELSEEEGLEAGLLASHDRMFRQHRRQEDLRRYGRDPSAVLIRYEDYFLGREADLFDLVAEKIQVSAADSLKEHLLAEFSIEKNKQRSRQFGGFDEYDSVTHVHGCHVSSDGRSGAWRGLFTPRVRDAVKQDLGGFLIEFGYEKGTNW